LKRFIYDSFEFEIMNKRQPRVKLSLLLGTIIALGVFTLAINSIPVQALHKEEQALDKFDNLKGFADAVSNGDEPKLLKKDIPLSSMKASNIYDDANKQTQDCINLAAKIGKGLDSKEVVNCVNDVNFYKNQISNSSVPTTSTSGISSVSADNGTGDTSTPTSDASTSKSDTSTPTSDASTSKSDTSTPTSDASTSSSGDVKENNMINELVKTGKFTENEAKDFVSKTMQNGAEGASTSGSPKTSNADTSTSDTKASDNTQSTSSPDNNANTQSTSSPDNNANTQSTSSPDNNANTQSTSSPDNNNQASNANSNKAIDYNDLKDLVHSIKNHVVDSDDITLTTFQDSGAYKGADQATQKCIDLAGKIGGKLGDQEIVHCSEDSNFYQNQISSNNANANDNNNNSPNNNNNANNANANNNNSPNDNNNNNNPDGTGTGN
jgi:hypothetical protein